MRADKGNATPGFDACVLQGNILKRDNRAWHYIFLKEFDFTAECIAIRVTDSLNAWKYRYGQQQLFGK